MNRLFGSLVFEIAFLIVMSMWFIAAFGGCVMVNKSVTIYCTQEPCDVSVRVTNQSETSTDVKDALKVKLPLIK